MSKKVYAGADIIFDNTTKSYPVTINTAEEFGIDGYRIQLSNSNNPSEIKHIRSYINSITDNGEVSPKFGTAKGPDVKATNPYPIPLHELVYLYPWQNGYYIIDSIDAEIPDVLYMLLYHTRPDGYENNMSTMINTDGNKQDVLTISVHSHTVGTTAIYPTTIVESSGLNDDTVELNKNAIGHYFLTVQENVLCDLYLKWFGTETPIKTISYKSSNYPHKPIIEKIVRDSTTYIRVTTDAPAHGNIYFNGGTEPTYTYITSRTAPYIAEIEINRVGAYTANIISEVVIENQHYFAYGELSDTLIVETQNVECTLSFNEYTGIISCVPDIEGSAEKFTLQKQSRSEWIDISENTIGEFKIIEGGTYKIIPTFGIFFTGTVFPESITVLTTLNTPVAYSDPVFPSQLGFDEVENANIYDVYRVSEDGEDELVATISPNNIISRIMRKEKMFIVIPNDEVRNV